MSSSRRNPPLPTHRQRPGRLVAHVVVLTIAVASIVVAARIPASSGASSVAVVPTTSMTAVGGSARDIAASLYYRPGAGLHTRESTASLDSVSDASTVRTSEVIPPVSSYSSSVGQVTAASNEVGAGIKPLADIIDPQVPYVLYDTQPGDSIASIANRYQIEQRTIFENNPTLSENDPIIHPGQQLIVPRDNGVLYKVGFGETVDSILQAYDNVTAGVVQDYRPNNISDPAQLRAGEFILLPNATLKPPPPPPPPPEPDPEDPDNGGGGSGSAPLPGGSGRFTYPLADWFRVSDAFGTNRGGGTRHTGIDLDLYGMSRSNIFSACDGVVSRTEYLTYSYGYHVVVDCGDGWSTLYAHMSSIAVTPGEAVSGGTLLGVSGLTGYTTGEHLHFEIRINGVPVNPADYLGF